MLIVNKLSAGYMPGMPIIHDVSLSTKRGEIVCIVGPNGSGKSTLLKSIAGLLCVESGNILLHDASIVGLRPDKLSHAGVAFVPQLDNVFRTMTIEQNLALASRRCHNNKSERLEAMLELFPDLKEKLNAKAGSLSGGQRQILALAMALIAEPTMLLLDEPSAGLSPKAAETVLGMLRPITRSGVAILMVEQNIKAGLTISDRAYVLADGQNQHEGQAQALLNDPILGEIYLGVRRGETHAAKSV